MKTQTAVIQSDRLNELKRLNLKTRNAVRTLLALDGQSSARILNKLRKNSPPSELMRIERVLRLPSKFSHESMLPTLFPTSPQTTENFVRLCPLELEKILSLINSYARENLTKLTNFFEKLKLINKYILLSKFEDAICEISTTIEHFGYSHLLLRKVVLVRSLAFVNQENETIERILENAGLERRSVFVTSLVNCYKEESDFLSLKKSIMGLPSRGRENKFTRDICRIPFHPIAKDTIDFSELIQSAQQSSLTDAIILIKANFQHYSEQIEKFDMLCSIFSKINSHGISCEDISSLYDVSDQESESNFYKHSSAWLEYNSIIEYRNLIDHFHDNPDSAYIAINDNITKIINNWIMPIKFHELASANNLTAHSYQTVKKLEIMGLITRSALFNYCMFLTEGRIQIGEDALFELMGKTTDLAKTSNIVFLKNFAQLLNSKLSQLVVYLLIARRSKNEQDDHRLRRIIQDIAKSNHNGNIVDLANSIKQHSRPVAEYLYDICTEDFIAKLFHIIKNSSEITETRAALHKWMCQVTGEISYFDRARNLLIDHQINKIRNEIDDHRIYVDASRFAEWILDEVIHELDILLASHEHQENEKGDEDPVLIALIQKCYDTFCSNKIFGIASYLGRRIRHGTFKGHLYSGVVAIERNEKYNRLISLPVFANKWLEWKQTYESKINEIIRRYLHIKSNDKKDGLLKPALLTSAKNDILHACSRTLVRDYLKTKTTVSASMIITEYCWRLAEVDLRDINVFLKNRKSDFLNNSGQYELKQAFSGKTNELETNFCRDLNRLIEEKFMSLYNWFKRPTNVSPKISLSLLYKAVAAEVEEVFPEFKTETDFSPENDIELIGGEYHILYDSLYVIIYNAAKHGKAGEGIQRCFNLVRPNSNGGVRLNIEISSKIRDEDSEEMINERLYISPEDDISGAQISEDRSGIRKLYQLQASSKNFHVEEILCKQRKVIVKLAYALDH